MKLFFKSLVVLFSVLLLANENLTAQNALAFDGINDMVVTSNASAKISGSNTISMTCWVNANKIGGPFGILGFRNNLNADFYILQLNATTLECRFRNSSGVNYDIVYSGFNLNQWEHYAFTYNGTQLELFKNGVSVATQAATGNILSSTETFWIGSLPWNTSNFIYGGIEDEVSVWDKALSATEVNCIYTQGINPAENNLQIYYDMNQGTANGNNSGLTTLIDRVNGVNGTLTNFSLSGTTSNYTTGVSTPTLTNKNICLGDSVVFGSTTYYAPGMYFRSLPTTSGCDSILALDLKVSVQEKSLSANICPGDSYTFGSMTLNKTGTYYDTVSSSALCDTVYKLQLKVRPEFYDSMVTTICNGESFPFGTKILTTEGIFSESFTSQYGCDSTIVVNLDVDSVNIGLSLNGNSLFANADQTKSTFEWIDCSTGTLVPNETSKFLTLIDVKEYAVIVKNIKSGCTDTSACLGLVTGIANLNSPSFKMMPNPAKDRLVVVPAVNYEQYTIEIMDITGQRLFSQSYRSQPKASISLNNLSSGIYFVKLITNQGEQSYKLVKE